MLLIRPIVRVRSTRGKPSYLLSAVRTPTLIRMKTNQWRSRLRTSVGATRCSVKVDTSQRHTVGRLATHTPKHSKTAIALEGSGTAKFAAIKVTPPAEPN